MANAGEVGNLVRVKRVIHRANVLFSVVERSCSSRCATVCEDRPDIRFCSVVKGMAHAAAALQTEGYLL
jgi:hypothetical protein